jgi:hypothetical protein
MSVHKPVLAVTTHFVDDIEARIDRDYDARCNPHERPFTRDELIEASSGADALFVTRLESAMLCLAFCSFRPTEVARDSSGTDLEPRSAGRSTDMRTFRPTTEFFTPGDL